MKRVVWLTDIHLNFIKKAQTEELCDKIVEAHPDLVLIGGDISEADELEAHLRALEARIERPIYFVLGNHDFYQGSIQSVRENAAQITQSGGHLRWLPHCGVVELTQHSALIGHDCWGDGRLGYGSRSRVILNDFFLIRELRESPDLFTKLNCLGEQAAEYFRVHLPGALERYRHILVLTHVPPFKESCWYEGKISDDEWLPHFTCHAVGEVLREMMEQHPNSSMTVLCGHTHGAGIARILPNLQVKTGAATYGSPKIQEVLCVD